MVRLMGVASGFLTSSLGSAAVPFFFAPGFCVRCVRWACARFGLARLWQPRADSGRRLRRFGILLTWIHPLSRRKVHEWSGTFLGLAGRGGVPAFLYSAARGAAARAECRGAGDRASPCADVMRVAAVGYVRAAAVHPWVCVDTSYGSVGTGRVQVCAPLYSAVGCLAKGEVSSPVLFAALP